LFFWRILWFFFWLEIFFIFQLFFFAIFVFWIFFCSFLLYFFFFFASFLHFFCASSPLLFFDFGTVAVFGPPVGFVREFVGRCVWLFEGRGCGGTWGMFTVGLETGDVIFEWVMWIFFVLLRVDFLLIFFYVLIEEFDLLICFFAGTFFLFFFFHLWIFFYFLHFFAFRFSPPAPFSLFFCLSPFIFFGLCCCFLCLLLFSHSFLLFARPPLWPGVGSHGKGKSGKRGRGGGGEGKKVGEWDDNGVWRGGRARRRGSSFGGCGKRRFCWRGRPSAPGRGRGLVLVFLGEFFFELFWPFFVHPVGINFGFLFWPKLEWWLLFFFDLWMCFFLLTFFLDKW